MLVEQRLGALALLLLLRALGLAATEPRTIGVSLLRRRFLCGAFPDSVQIDDITHARLHHLEDRRKRATAPRENRLNSHPRIPVCPYLIAPITEFRSAETKFFVL